MAIYEHSVKAMDGSMISLKDYEGKVLLIVNTVILDMDALCLLLVGKLQVRAGFGRNDAEMIGRVREHPALVDGEQPLYGCRYVQGPVLFPCAPVILRGKDDTSVCPRSVTVDLHSSNTQQDTPYYRRNAGLPACFTLLFSFL